MASFLINSKVKLICLQWYKAPFCYFGHICDQYQSIGQDYISIGCLDDSLVHYDALYTVPMYFNCPANSLCLARKLYRGIFAFHSSIR